MDDCASSGGSDYSSMANSTTDLEAATATMAKTPPGRSPSRSTTSSSVTSASTTGALNVSVQQEMRTITDDYNALLRTATEQIRALTAERADLHDQCEQLLGVNEDLVRDMAVVLAREAALKRENQKILAANKELFDEAQRLNDAEADRDRAKDETDTATANTRRLEEALETARSDLRRTQERLRCAEDARDSLERRHESMAGENMQLMLDADEQAKAFRHKTHALQQQLDKANDRNAALEKENARLRAAPPPQPQPVAAVASSKSDDKRMEALVEKNKNLTEWREQLIGKNKALTDENEKLKRKCEHLEDLLSEEETNINDMLEFVAKLQASGSPGTGAVLPRPMSKLRELHFK